MELESLFTNAKWKIIQYLAKEKLSPIQLAQKTKTSIANISQQLALLDAFGFVKKEKAENKNKKGKPKRLFYLANDFAYIVYAKNNYANKKLLKPDSMQQILLNILFLDKKEDQYYITKFLWKNEEILLSKTDAIFFLKSDKDLELTVITDNENNLKEIRTQLSNQTIENSENKKKKIVVWSHNMQEIEDGLKKAESYFNRITDNLYSIYDPKKLLTKIEVLRNE